MVKNLFFYNFLILLFCSACNTQKQPNIIVIITDDQGYGDLEVYGNPHLKTPNLDKLHNESIRLTNFHVAPACTPTRSQLITGIDAMHNGAYSAHGQFHLLDKKHQTIFEVFQEKGYRTALYGKWHLGANSIGYRPHERGLDDAVYFLRGGHWSHPNPWNSDCMDDQYYHNGKLEQFNGYSNDIWFDLGQKFVEDCKANNNPFFLYLPLNAPHLPWLAPERYRTPYLDKGLDKESINFFAMISAVDEQMGKFINFLKVNNEWENTIFIFTSDNGSTLWQQEYNAGMRGKKASEYEGGHRVPFFISWPYGQLKSPRDISTLTEVQDIFPTLLDLCGISPKKEIAFEGISLANILSGKPQPELEERIEVVQFAEEKYKSSIMYKNWRLVNGNELYDLSVDPAQEKNIFETHPQITKLLLEHYENWWEKADARLMPPPYFVNNEEAIKLTAYDWYGGPRVYNWPHLRRGEKSNGKYRLMITEDGKYNISLRRWPREANAGITESVPAFTPFDSFLGELPEGKALDIVKAKIKIAGEVLEEEVSKNDGEIQFEIDLPKGEQELQTWFIDSNDEGFGAYYVYINAIK